jgi:hypothetical protein
MTAARHCWPLLSMPVAAKLPVAASFVGISLEEFVRERCGCHDDRNSVSLQEGIALWRNSR